MAIAGYNFYENGVKLNTSLLASPTYTRIGLGQGESGTCYFTAVDDSGNESGSGEQGSFTTLTGSQTQLAAPTGFAYTGVQGGIKLDWSNVANNAGYLLEVSSQASGGFAVLADLPANTVTYSHTGLVAGDRRNYRLTAKGSGSFVSSSPATVQGVAGVHLLNDEFNAASIDTAKFSIVNPNPADVSFEQAGGKLVIKALPTATVAHNAYNNRLESKGTYGDSLVEIRQMMLGDNTSVMYFGLAVDSNNFVVGSRQQDTKTNLRVLYKLNNVNTLVDTSTFNMFQAQHYVRIKRAGDTFSVFTSPDGFAWTQVGTDTVRAIGAAARFIYGLGPQPGLGRTIEVEHVKVIQL